MRILIVDTFYRPVLIDFYRRNPEQREADYARQWRSLMDTFFGTADSYSYYLKTLGHDAHEVVANALPLQRAWVRGQDRPTRFRIGRPEMPGWQDRVVLAQFERFSPDVVLIHNLSLLRTRTLRRMKRTSSLVGQIASELPSPRRIKTFDLILTSFPHYPTRIERLGTKSAFLRLGFDPRVLERLDPLPEETPVAFVGSLGLTQHRRGNALLSRVAEQVPLVVWGLGIEDWPRASAIARAYRGEAWGLDMYRALNTAKISLNRHIDVAEDHANNMRLYEATGVGSMLLTDRKADLGQLFEVGEEVVAYETDDELVELVRTYLADDDARREIARAGQARTLREHTWEQRMRELVEILERDA